MEVTFNRSDLMKSLSFLSSFTAKSSTIPVLGSIKVSAASGDVVMVATNIESSACCRMSGKVSDGGSVLVPYGGFRGFAGSATGAEIKLRSTEKTVILESGRSRVQFRIDPKHDLPETTFSGEHLLTAPAGEIQKLFLRTSFIHRDTLHTEGGGGYTDPSMGSQGVRIQTSPKGVTATAHDGKRVGRARYAVSCVPGFETTLPPDAARWLAGSQWDRECPVMVYRTSGGIVFGGAGDTAFFRVTNISLPDMKTHFDMKFDYEGTVNVEDFISAIDTVAMFSESEAIGGGKRRTVTMTFKPGDNPVIEFTGESSMSGVDSSASMVCRHNGTEEFSTRFNPAFLTDFARSCGATAFVIRFGKGVFYRMEPVGDSLYVYLANGFTKG